MPHLRHQPPPPPPTRVLNLATSRSNSTRPRIAPTLISPTNPPSSPKSPPTSFFKPSSRKETIQTKTSSAPPASPAAHASKIPSRTTTPNRPAHPPPPPSLPPLMALLAHLIRHTPATTPTFPTPAPRTTLLIASATIPPPRRALQPRPSLQPHQLHQPRQPPPLHRLRPFPPHPHPPTLINHSPRPISPTASSAMMQPATSH